MVNVSPRSVAHALKLLRDGNQELLAKVESGALAVSKAGALVRRRKQEQPEPSPVEKSFRVLRAENAALLLVDAAGLVDAVKALEARGFRQHGRE